MFPKSPGCTGHLLHPLPDGTVGMQFHENDPHQSHPAFISESISVNSNQKSLLYDHGGLGLSSGIHEQDAHTANGSYELMALQDPFRCHNLPVDDCVCRCSFGTVHGQMLQGNTIGGVCRMQRPHRRTQVNHCAAPVYNGKYMRMQEAGSSDEGQEERADVEIERNSVEYEYYVWDAAAQEYVQTDQKTGQKMLQDPHYLQYHYKLVEDTQSGEAHLLPERLEDSGFAEFYETEIPNSCRFVDSNHPLSTELEEGVSGIAFSRNVAQSVSKREALMTPHRRCCSSLSTRSAACLHEPQSSPKYLRESWEKENGLSFAFDVHSQHPENGNVKDVNDTQCNVGKLPSGRQDTLRRNWDVVPSNMRLFIPCSRPWENASASVGNRETRLRHLRHLQRVQSLEKEELLRRQMSMDKIAASIPRLRKHSLTPEVYGSLKTHTPLQKERGSSGKKTTRPCLPNGSTGGDRRARSDPVSRGRYFREKWKSDRFLEQQRHPAFDVKAYDAWLKSSGHLLRARALELQQEEQRLVSLLRQEKNCRLKRCGY